MMKDYMDGLSVKVFRTYNASVTLNRLLFEDTESQEVVSHKADYDRANKEVWALFPSNMPLLLRRPAIALFPALP